MLLGLTSQIQIPSLLMQKFRGGGVVGAKQPLIKCFYPALQNLVTGWRPVVQTIQNAMGMLGDYCLSVVWVV